MAVAEGAQHLAHDSTRTALCDVSQVLLDVVVQVSPRGELRHDVQRLAHEDLEDTHHVGVVQVTCNFKLLNAVAVVLPEYLHDDIPACAFLGGSEALPEVTAAEPFPLRVLVPHLAPALPLLEEGPLLHGERADPQQQPSEAGRELRLVQGAAAVVVETPKGGAHVLVWQRGKAVVHAQLPRKPRELGERQDSVLVDIETLELHTCKVL
mmetsp:Transcript_118469/g.295607  ORF Transcript_118469/g.295607 Transcript_118469/m.295607 type:complete len:209 (-) Transcript_118469:1036-1662(-)